MRNLIERFPTQLNEAVAIAKTAKLTPATNPIQHVLIAGMGGSGIGGNLVQSFTFDSAKLPITVYKSYDVPTFVGPNTLFIACSFSGGTEETLASTATALKRGAKVVAITSGGALGKFCTENGLDQINIPGESGSPRASIGYSFVNIMQVLAFYGVVSDAQLANFEAAASLIEAEAASIQTLAKGLAAGMKDKLPVLYSDSRLEPVMLRALQQIAENSKQISHVNVLPEMNHNELVGWAYAKQIWADSYTVLFRSTYDNPRTSMRMNICKEIFEKVSPTVIEVTAKGSSFIEQALYLTIIIDWVSFFLAEENGVDPFPVDVITYLKNELAKHA